MAALRTVRSGNAIIVTASITNPAGAAYSPSGAVTLTIVDPTGAIALDAASMTATGVGAYSYTFNVPAAAAHGIWQGYVNASDAGVQSGSPATALFIA
jgi:hypothetical protein